MSEDLLPVFPQASELSAPAKQFLSIFDPTEQAEMRQVLEDNLGPAGLNPALIERIKVPTGGAQLFTLEGIEGSEAIKEMTGIALAWTDSRIYYRVAFSERGKQRTPPDCASKDGFYGIGNPGGECRTCPMAEWGSDTKGGRGQACKQVRRILFLRTGHLLPEMVMVPPTSRKNAEQYFLRLGGRGIRYWSLLTNLRLERASNADGIDFARITFTSGEHFSPLERGVLAGYHAKMMGILRNVEVEPDYQADTDEHERDD